MFNASDLRKGLKIEIEGDPYEIVEFQFVKPGKGQAMYKCRIKNLKSGSVIDKTFRVADKIDKPDLQQRDMIYSYQEGDRYIFMDAESYEQVEFDATILGEKRHFLIEDMECEVLFHNNIPLEISLPFFIEKVVAETEPGVRGDTATNVNKPARLDNGYELQVPLFINQGDTIRIDTRTGKYADRVSKN